MQLKSNKVPKGPVALERSFDKKDKAHFAKVVKKLEDLEEINLGTTIAPKNIYIGKRLSLKV